MRTTLTIDDDVMAAVRDIAAAQGRSLGSVLSDLARRALAPAAVRQDERVPVFDVPADAPIFGTDHVRSALEQE